MHFAITDQMLAYVSSWLPSRQSKPVIMDEPPPKPIHIEMVPCRRCMEGVDPMHAINIREPDGQVHKYHVRCFTCKTCNASLICKLRRVEDGEVHGVACH